MTLTEYKVIFEITDDLYSTQASDNPDALWQAELYIGPLLKGDNGKSAYELAVQHGYVGTEEEWLASLSAEVTAENIEEALGYVPADPSDFPIMRGTGEHSIVQEGGYAVQASGENTIAFGELTFASGRDSFASGYKTKARQRAHRFTEIRNGNQLVLNSALGFFVNELVSIINKTKYYNCSRITAIDGNVITLDSLPFNSMVEDESFDHHTVFDALNTDIGSIEIGYYATATGWNTVAAGLASHAEGRDTRSYGQYSHVEGRQTSAGYAAHAEGQNSHAPGERSHAEGHQTISPGNNAHAEGTTTTASGNNSHAEGNTTTAQGLNAHSEGSATVATGDSSHAEGQGSTASGIISHAEGFSTAASGLYAHAEGQQTSASGGASHAEGAANTSSGLYSHVEGSNNQAIGNSSHAEGDHTAAGGPGSHSEGYESTATGYYSHAEGQNTHAEGDNSHAEGWKSVAEAHNSHAEGGGTHTYSEYSHAEGEGTKTRNRCEHAQGKYNKSNTELPIFGYAGNTLHSIGIGDELQDKNAVEVMQNGDVYILGLGQYDGTNPSVASSLQQVLTGFVTASTTSLVNYYLKSETYTKTEVAALIGAIQQFHYEVYASKQDVTSPASNVLYLIGPTGSGTDQYEEYVYDSTKQDPWIKIGDTSVDLSGYVTIQALNTALAAYTTTANLTTLLATKQDTISDLAAIRAGAVLGANAYQKPTTGIPESDLESAVRTTLDTAVLAPGGLDTDVFAYTPDDELTLKSGVVPTALADLSEDTTHRVVTDAEKSTWNGKYTKPTTGIPASDLASGVIKNPSIFIGTCGSAAGSAALEATVTTFPTDINGKPIVGTMVGIKFINNHTTTIGNVTLNVNNTGAYSIYYNTGVTTTGGREFTGTANRYIYYVFDGTYWSWVSYGQDADTNTTAYIVRSTASTRPVSDYCGRYRLLFSGTDGTKWVPATATASTNATAVRTVNTRAIDPFGPIVYYAYTTILQAGDTPSTSYQYTQGEFTLGYSFNSTGSALVLTPNLPIYIKCAPQSDGSAIIDDTTPYVFTLPSTADGKIYIFLGLIATTTTVYLYGQHPIYYYSNGGIRLWTGMDVYAEIHPAIQSSQPQDGFLSNIEYDLGTITGSVTFALATPISGITNHYYWTFDTSSTAPTVTWPSGITWYGGSAPTINASKHYEISVLNNIGVAMEV